jgi:hypothetical protein
MGVSEGTGGGVAFERGRGGRGVRTRSGDATRRDRSRRVRNLYFSGGARETDSRRGGGDAPMPNAVKNARNPEHITIHP